MDIQEIEKYLCQIRSVNSCRIQRNDNGDILEVHIVADLSRNPKQISRDIQSVFVTEFGIDLDYKKISIAQVKSEDVECMDFRLKFKTLEYLTADRKSEVRVTLGNDDELYDGTDSGPNTVNNTLRMLARATFRAIEKFYGIEESFILDDVKPVSLAGKDIIVIVVTSVLDSREHLLSGSAIVEGDRKEAVIRASLNAVNRIVSKLPH